jgi:hypothetical protein
VSEYCVERVLLDIALLMSEVLHVESAIRKKDIENSFRPDSVIIQHSLTDHESSLRTHQEIIEQQVRDPRELTESTPLENESL